MLAALLPLAALATCAAPLAAPLPLAAPAAPVLDADFPDPAVLKAPDGFYYAFATQSEVGGKMLNMQVARSSDLLRWHHFGDALPAKPAWASKTQDFWAPHVSRHGATYYLYYSAKPDAALTDDKRGLCLAVATSPHPQGPFTDIGKPLQCGDGFVNIDPMAYDDPATGKRLLYWGSGFQPIKVQELAPDRISFAPGSAPADLIPVVKSEDPNEYRRLIEGAWVVRRDGWYYMFYSGDNCCGPKAHYAVLVARSRNATGPFEAPQGTSAVILEKYGKWLAPGHNAIATDARGQDWIVYHAIDTGRPRSKPTADVNTRRILLIDKIVWAGGWPRIEVNGPSTEPRAAPGAR